MQEKKLEDKRIFDCCNKKRQRKNYNYMCNTGSLKAERVETLKQEDEELYNEYVDLLDDLNESWEETLKRMEKAMRGE